MTDTSCSTWETHFELKDQAEASPQPRCPGRSTGGTPLGRYFRRKAVALCYGASWQNNCLRTTYFEVIWAYPRSLGGDSHGGGNRAKARRHFLAISAFTAERAFSMTDHLQVKQILQLCSLWHRSHDRPPDHLNVLE